LVEWRLFFQARFLRKERKGPKNTKVISNWTTKEAKMYKFELAASLVVLF